VTGGSGGPAGVIVAAIRNNGAAVIGLGLADVFTRNPATERSEDKISDQAAGSIAIEQAGGRLTDLIGAPLDFGAARALSEIPRPCDERACPPGGAGAIRAVNR